MPNPTYDYTLVQRLRTDRKTRLAAAREVVDRARAEGRPELHAHEAEAIQAATKAVATIDAQLKDQSAAMVKTVLGSPRDGTGDTDGEARYLSLRTPRLKSDLTSRFGSMLGDPGLKALVPDGEPIATIPMDPVVYREGETPTSLIEVLPAIQRPVVYRYLRQTSRDNNAAPVAPGDLKPTSTYGLTPVEGRLHVIAHISEPIDKYLLQDGPSLAAFVEQEMIAGLHQTVEAQVVSGDGLGENLTGLANTSGIQTQAHTTSPVLTARAAVTKVETLGFAPAWFVINPIDWERIETATLDAGQYVLNAEGSRNGIPVDSATRRLWGTGVTVSTAVPAGTGYLLSNGAVQLATGGNVEVEQSSAIGDDFARNAIRFRVEARFDLAVTRPMGVVKMALTGA